MLMTFAYISNVVINQCLIVNFKSVANTPICEKTYFGTDMAFFMGKTRLKGK